MLIVLNSCRLLSAMALAITLLICAGCETRVFHPCTQGAACPTCHGMGSYRCTTCLGRGQDRCSSCNGTGRSMCWSCTGQGTQLVPQFNPITHRTDQLRQPCSACFGTGKGACVLCNGSGMKACDACGGSGMRNCGTYTIENR